MGHISGINFESLPQILLKISWSQGLSSKLSENCSVTLKSRSRSSIIKHYPRPSRETSLVSISKAYLKSFQSYHGHKAYLQNYQRGLEAQLRTCANQENMTKHEKILRNCHNVTLAGVPRYWNLVPQSLIFSYYWDFQSATKWLHNVKPRDSLHVHQKPLIY